MLPMTESEAIIGLTMNMQFAPGVSNPLIWIVGGIVIAVISSVVTTRYRAYEEAKEETQEAVNEMKSVVYGVEHMEGMVDVMESHDESIDELEDELEHVRGMAEANRRRLNEVKRRLRVLVEKNRDGRFKKSDHYVNDESGE